MVHILLHKEIGHESDLIILVIDDDTDIAMRKYFLIGQFQVVFNSFGHLSSDPIQRRVDYAQ